MIHAYVCVHYTLVDDPLQKKSPLVRRFYDQPLLFRRLSSTCGTARWLSTGVSVGVVSLHRCDGSPLPATLLICPIEYTVVVLVHIDLERLLRMTTIRLGL